MGPVIVMMPRVPRTGCAEKEHIPEKRKVALLTIAVIILVAGDRPGICLHIAYKGVGAGAAVKIDRRPSPSARPLAEPRRSIRWLSAIYRLV